MSLVLAIEPDHRQASILKRIVRESVRADFVLVDSRDAAVAAIAARIPDVILVTTLLSPRDEEELVSYLRELGGAEHLQTYTIPQLASSAEDMENSGGGLFGKFRKKKAETIPGCDPDHFAQEIRTFLDRANERRAEWAVSAQHRKAQQEFDTRTEFETAVKRAASGHAPIPTAAEPISEVPADSAWADPFAWRPAAERAAAPPSVSSMVTKVPLAVVAEDQEANVERERDVERQRLAAEADERQRREAETRAREEAEARARETERRREQERAEAEAAARRKREEEERRRLEAEAAARRNREEEERKRREEEERKRLEADAAARKKREDEERKRWEEEERKRLEAEAAARRKREEEERKRLEAEAAARKKREDEERKRREEEERKRLEAEAAERRKREEEERKRLEAEAAARKKREEEERKRSEEEERKRLEAEAAARRKRDEQEEERRRTQEEARRRAEEEARRREEDEARRRDEEAARQREIAAKADPFKEFRAEHDEPTGILRLIPVSSWARVERRKSTDEEEPAAHEEFQQLLAGLRIPEHVAAISYPRGVRIRRVRVRALDQPPPAGDTKAPLIVSRKALQHSRVKHSSPDR